MADHEILDKREQFGLDGYVPFHFHPYTAFDVALKRAIRIYDFLLTKLLLFAVADCEKAACEKQKEKNEQ